MKIKVGIQVENLIQGQLQLMEGVKIYIIYVQFIGIFQEILVYALR